MTKTSSIMAPLGMLAPEFTLIDVISNKYVHLKRRESKNTIATVIMFICNHCPYVKHIRHELVHLVDDYAPQNVRFIAINANDIEKYPDDSPENMKKTALEEKFNFPYLFDETQEVARAYSAACTPDFFIFDKKFALVYRGQLDNARLGNNIKVNGNSIRMTLDCLLESKPVPEVQIPSLGCNIKWK